MDLLSVLSFLGTAVLLTLLPGPDNMFVLAQSIAHGRKAGIATTLGLCTGLLVHITAATLGISAIIYQSALAFNIVKYAGAAYLLYLAWKSFRARDEELLVDSGQLPALHFGTLYRRGIVMSSLNPKVSLFFLALLPPFVNQQAGYVPLQMLVLGFIFLIQALILFSIVSVCAGRVRGWLIRRPRISRKINTMQGVIFTLIGLKVAFSSR
ncbi:LysE family translocator [Paenibacillus bovis]|uniref:Threonine transporter RhtB n=1 Tax=Paenibacillus bovis TaxID=1616788 RepID=A0A172ZBE2_9BACL|nr:LysE family translocator [Paenibacillus bovis]ANF94966.1 threonine transporter RhtB [Paenibacillus bovis]